MSKCKACDNEPKPTSPHNTTSDGHIDTMKNQHIRLTSEFDKFFYLLNNGMIGVEFTYQGYINGEQQVNGFKVVINE